jgi:hypothetical protein
LSAAIEVVTAREPAEKFDWNKTWLTEIFLSAEEKKIRKAQLERQRGITPEIKRHNEIKAGVIVGSVGIALAIFLFVFMGGLIASGTVSPAAAAILSRLWIAGVIPLFVGLALIANGAIVSKRIVEAAGRGSQLMGEGLEEGGKPPSLTSATSEFPTSPFSVTEEATKHLDHSREK